MPQVSPSRTVSPPGYACFPSLPVTNCSQDISQDAINQPVLSERWLALPESATNPLKHLSLSTLGSPQLRAGAVAAQCVSAIAAIELPVGKWPELIPQLLEFVQNQDNTGLRVNTLQAVGYICEVIVSYHDPSDILSSTDIHIAT